MAQGISKQLYEMMSRAVGHLQAGRLREAEAGFREVVRRQPDYVDGWQLLGVALGQSKKHAEAARCLEKALKLGGEHPVFRSNLGEVYRSLERLEDAEASLRIALQIAPNFPEAHYNLANVLKQKGDDEAAVVEYRRTLELAPNHEKARFNLGNVLREQGRVQAAVAEYQQALALKPNWYEAHLNLGNALAELSRTKDAIAEYQKAEALAPADSDVADNIGDAYVKQGLRAQAADCYRRALARRPERWLRRLRLECLADVIPESNASIDVYRENLLQTITAFHAETRPIDPAEIASSGAEPPMLLTYQGRDDRAIKEAYASLFLERIAPLEAQPGEGLPHVGIVVTNGHEGVFARCLGALVERLPTTKMKITVACSLAGRNVLSHLFFKRPMNYLVLPSRVDEAAAALRDARFDLLHYWEIGTDSMNYFLPFYRPAPIQTTTWGWPTTTGNPRVEAFVSAECIETPTSDRYYLEELIRLRSTPTYYERPPVPTQRKSREQLGWPEEGRIYLCVQNVRKYHPDFDAVLAKILALDPKGRLLVIADEQPTITEQLATRLEKSLPEGRGRLKILGRMEREEYLNALTLADVCLDTPHYGGGANTVYDALAAGAPTIALAGEQHRGRFAAATFRALGLSELAVDSLDDYAPLAVRIASEPDFRKDVSERMIAAGEGVFSDQRAVEAYAEFFLERIGALRASGV